MAEANFEEYFDAELFIDEIRKYPAIWDVASDAYHNRDRKRHAWLDICNVFFGDFNDKDERDKREICNKLIKKWRNIKDNFLKSTKKKTRSGQPNDVSRRYIYARHLSFLNQSGATTDQTSMGGGEDDGQSEDSRERADTSGPSPTPSSQHYEPSAKKSKRSVESSLINFMNTPEASQTRLPNSNDSNADMSFFDSLIPSLNEFTEDQKLELRCEILNIIQRMRMRRPQNDTSSLNQQLDNKPYAEHPSAFTNPDHDQVQQPTNSNFDTAFEHDEAIVKGVSNEDFVTDGNLVRIKTEEDVGEEITEAVHMREKPLQSTEITKDVTLPEQSNVKDDDYYFVMSLLPQIRKFKDLQNMKVKIEIMKILAQELESL